MPDTSVKILALTKSYMILAEFFVERRIDCNNHKFVVYMDMSSEEALSIINSEMDDYVEDFNNLLDGELIDDYIDFVGIVDDNKRHLYANSRILYYHK